MIPKQAESVRGGRIGSTEERTDLTHELYERAVGANEATVEPGGQLRMQQARDVVWRWQLRRRRR